MYLIAMMQNHFDNILFSYYPCSCLEKARHLGCYLDFLNYPDPETTRFKNSKSSFTSEMLTHLIDPDTEDHLRNKGIFIKPSYKKTSFKEFPRWPGKQLPINFPQFSVDLGLFLYLLLCPS